MPARPDLAIVLHAPVDGSDTARKLQQLASADDRPETPCPLAG